MQVRSSNGPQSLWSSYSVETQKANSSKEVGLSYADGVIATNFHVVGNAYTCRVKLSSGDVYDDVSILQTDERKDIAIIQIRGMNLPALTMADSDQVKVGSTVYAVGAPLGLEGSITSGLISSIRPVNEMFSWAEGFRVMQISTPVTHGSSGCPVLNEKGEVIGLVFAARVEGQNLNAAIPINYVHPLVSTSVAATALKQFPKAVPTNVTATPKVINESINGLAGVYSGNWASENFPSSGSLVITISVKDQLATVNAVFTGSEVLNQEEFVAKFTSIGSGVLKMEYVGKTTGITGTGILNDGRFSGDYKFDPDSGKWSLALKGMPDAPIVVTAPPTAPSKGVSTKDDYEYGSLSELRGIKKIYIQTGIETSYREQIIKELEKTGLNLQILASEENAECVIIFRNELINEPWFSGGTAIVEKSLGQGMVILVGKGQQRHKLLYKFRETKDSWFEGKPIGKFAKIVAAGFKDANR